MSYWIFKVAAQELYLDMPGERYVYDNTHSIQVQKGDVFLYLDKRNGYGFTGSGLVQRVSKRNPTSAEAARTDAVRTVFTAYLEDVMWLTAPLSISPRTSEGRKNRAKLGILDVNLLGWSQSMPRLTERMYNRIMDLVEREHLLAGTDASEEVDYSVDDQLSTTRKRKKLSRWTDGVLDRHDHTCVVCGTRVEAVLDAAHLSPYATDKSNRANPANGICLCVFCHRLLDGCLIAIQPDGHLLVAGSVCDPVAGEHLKRITDEQRRTWLQGIDATFLEMTARRFQEASQ